MFPMDLDFDLQKFNISFGPYVARIKKNIFKDFDTFKKYYGRERILRGSEEKSSWLAFLPSLRFTWQKDSPILHLDGNRDFIFFKLK